MVTKLGQLKKMKCREGSRHCKLLQLFYHFCTGQVQGVHGQGVHGGRQALPEGNGFGGVHGHQGDVQDHLDYRQRSKHKDLGSDLLNVSNTTNSIGVKFSGLA